MSEGFLPGLVLRVDRTLEESAGRFPATADPVTGEWTWSHDGGWSGGFWPGLLSLCAVATGNDTYAEAAASAAGRLTARATAPTLLRGLLFWYGRAGADTVAAARALAEDFDPVGGLLPPGEEDAARYDWPRPGACVDGLPGTVPLLASAAERTGDPLPRDRALAHARGTARLCVRSDGSVAQTATYDACGQLVGQVAVNGSSPDSTWARAQAWAMLGLAQAAHLWQEFLPDARRIADWYLAHVPADMVCYWDFDDPAIPDAPRDTSATAIAAAALAQLDGENYIAAATSTVAALAGGHIGAHGGLVDGCYNHNKGLAVNDELIWGDYFLMEATLALAGVLDPAGEGNR